MKMGLKRRILGTAQRFGNNRSMAVFAYNSGSILIFKAVYNPSQLGFGTQITVSAQCI